jgi:rfaE bifunctional protein kinase chain/domain
MVADEYLIGRPARISREAPVLILHYSDSFVRPGGATNTAYNLSSLGAHTSVVGVIGDDEMGQRLRRALKELNISTDGLVVDPNRPTSTKTRVVGKGAQEAQQQIVRIDRVDTTPVDGTTRNQLIRKIFSTIPHVEALLISDYENGVISPDILEACLPKARQHDLTITVDSHGDLFRFKGVTAATPNQPEAESTLHTVITGDEELEAAGGALLDGMEAQAVLITRGSEGVALFEREKPMYLIPASVSDENEVVDPTGAGDTVAAAFTLAIACGAPMRMAAHLANVAGGEVVRKLGPATLSQQQLTEGLQRSPTRPPR